MLESFSINLEHIGDIIEKNLSELAAKKVKRRLQQDKRSRLRQSALFIAEAGPARVVRQKFGATDRMGAIGIGA